jgi:hypothetical protein
MKNFGVGVDFLFLLLVGYCAHQPQMIGDGDRGAIKIGRGNRSTLSKPVPLCTSNPSRLDRGSRVEDLDPSILGLGTRWR